MNNYKKIIGATLLGGFLLTGCSMPYSDLIIPNSSGEQFVYNNISFGNGRDESFKQGVRDGCRTASGTYTKNHASFNSSRSYHAGWANGRLKCKGK